MQRVILAVESKSRFYSTTQVVNDSPFIYVPFSLFITSLTMFFLLVEGDGFTYKVVNKTP